MIYVPELATAGGERRGVVLLVVMALLALFAAVGLSFVFYADAEATAAEWFRAAGNVQDTNQPPDYSAEAVGAFFLSQLIYDADDTYGVYSALRGHSLGRNMYGYNASGLNVAPYNGIGRPHYTQASLGNNDDFPYVNYTYYQADGFIRDPERIGSRASNTAPQTNQFVAGSVSYTYPDHNNMFLAAVNANGEVLLQSYYRPWLESATDPYKKYRYLRPDPTYHDAKFAASLALDSDGGGNVQNLEGSKGTVYYVGAAKNYYKNDSFWLDPGFPTITAADGKKFRVLVAPLIIDLDGKLNLNVHGNIRGTGNSHVSNLGLGAWEVNLARGLTGSDTGNLFLGATVGTKTYKGRYGPDGAVAKSLSQIPAPATSYQQIPRSYSFLDFDGIINPDYPTNNYALAGTYNPSDRPLMPGETGNSNPEHFGFRNIDPLGWSSTDDFERTNHPALFNPLNPGYTSSAGASDDRIFDWTDQEALLRFGLKGSNSGKSELLQMLPKNFNDPTDATTIAASARRRWLSAISTFDLGRPGATGWLDPSDAAYVPYTLTGPYPTGAASPFPSASFPATGAGEFGSDWRGVNVALGRLDMNRPLVNYPAVDAISGLITDTTAFNAAQTERQNFARDIYDRLRWLTTGKAPSATMPNPNTPEWKALRWLAQLAVNIVDYRDNDDYITPFNWDTSDPSDLERWVYGTELPKLVINESYVEVITDPTDPLSANKATLPYLVNFWVELLNPMKDDSVQFVPRTVTITDATNASPIEITAVGHGYATGQKVSVFGVLGNTAANGLWTITKVDADKFTLNGSTANAAYTSGGKVIPNPAVSSYKLTIATPPASGSPFTDTNLGTPDTSLRKLEVADYSPEAAPTPQPGVDVTVVLPAGTNYSGPSGENKGFYVLGPGGKTGYGGGYDFPSDVGVSPAPPVPTLRVKDQTFAGVRSAMTYTIPNTTAVGSFPTHNLFLRRLACPHLPEQIDPAAANYNPYVTVDYIENVPARDGVKNDNNGVHTPTAIDARKAKGRKQPYAAHSSQQVDQDPSTANVAQPQHTFFRHNGREASSPTNSATLTLPFDWLVHMDRYLASPIEIMQTSAFEPYNLTQQFITGAGATNKFTHRAPWFDPTARLYRLFEFLEVGNRTAGVSNGGRIPGKININTIYGPLQGSDTGDEETFQAVADAQGVSSFTSAEVKAMFANMLAARTGGGGVPGVPGSNGDKEGDKERPFKSLATGNIANGDSQFTQGSGIGDTFFRVVTPITDPSSDPNQVATAQRLFEIAPVSGTNNPYVKMELMSKIFNNVTTRSHVFAVWLTIGFFEVVDADAKPPKLGAEINRATNKHIRHRVFAIVDRSQLRLFPTATDPVTATVVSASSTPPVYTVQCNPGATNLKGANGTKWSIQAGMLLEVDTGGNAQTVTVISVTGNTFTARFERPPVLDQPLSLMGRGNPGPVSSTNPAVPAGVNPKYDPRQDPVVTYFSVID